MTTDPNAALVEALEHFLREAKETVDEERHRDALLWPTPQMLAERLAELPAGREAASAAHHAAATNGYSVSAWPRRRSGEPAGTTDTSEDSDATASRPSCETTEPSGRPFDAEMLISTGVIGMLHSSATQDFHAVAEELAGYLAGPPVLIWDYAILDASFTTDAPIPVIDGWELVTPTSEDLRQMLPLPAAAKYQQKGPFKPQDYGGLTMFRRSLEQRPHHGPILRWDVLYSLALNRPAQPRTTVPGPAAARPADLLQRDFTATAPGRKWVGVILSRPVDHALELGLCVAGSAADEGGAGRG